MNNIYCECWNPELLKEHDTLFCKICGGFLSQNNPRLKNKKHSGDSG